ncbi:hypothetical protein B0A49_13660, partial [Cryomyces minteri]
MSEPQSRNKEEELSSSSEEEELPQLPVSRPSSVISVATSLKPKSTSELRGKTTKVEKHHKKEPHTADKLKKLLEKEPSLVSNLESSSKQPKTAKMSDDRGIKPKNPDTYSGGNKDLERFLSQCQLYFLLKKDDFKNSMEKVLFAGSHLRGPAADWFTPFIRDISKGQDARQETRSIFGSYINFERALEQLYGSRDRQRTAVRQLQQLKQLGPASQYTASFRRLAIDSGWNDAALITTYYSGLRDSIKDELSRSERPASLDDLIDRVITIDERFFERRMERGKQGSTYQPRNQQNRQPYYGPEPMDLSATRGPLSNKDREHRMKNNLCLYCGKPGHRARECKANKGRNNSLAATHHRDPYDDDDNGPPQYLKATRAKPIPDWVKQMSETSSQQDKCNEWFSTVHADEGPSMRGNTAQGTWVRNTSRVPSDREHASLSWTACYDDYCTIHRSGKEGRGGFPQKLRQKQRHTEDEYEEIPRPLNIPQRPRTPYPEQLTRFEQHDVDTGETKVWYAPKQDDTSDTESTETSSSEESLQRIHIGKDPPKIIIPQGRLIFWSYDQENVVLRIEVAKTGDLGNLPDFPYQVETDKEPNESEHKAKDEAARPGSHERRPVESLPSIQDSQEDSQPQVTAMIDSGATGNFISHKAILRLGLRKQEKKQKYSLRLIDGTEIGYGKVTHETQKTTMKLDTHNEQINFDITDTGTDEIVLGIPWLRIHNPTINWSTGKLQFTRCNCETTRPSRLRIPAEDEEHDQDVMRECIPDLRLKKRDLHWLSATSTDKSTIPQEYQKYTTLFKEDLPSEALPKHQTWDHDIPLVEGTTPAFQKIYPMNEEQLKALREYLDENLKKGFIRESKSPAAYPLFFVTKKNTTKLRPVIDYRQLNNITIKNRYPLPLIGETMDRLRGAFWFTKVDLKGAYNLIRMKEGEEWKTAFRT